MSMRIAVVIGLAFALTVVGCGDGGQTKDGTEDSRAPQSNEERQAEIAEMEADLTDNAKLDQGVDRAKADRLIKLYSGYINVNPRDSVSAEYLFKAADLSVGMGKPEAAIRFLDRLTTDFTNYDRIVEIWLFKAFIYEAHMNSYAEAAATYRKLIEKYPNHRLAEQAEAAIDNLTLSEEELLEKLKSADEKES